MRQLHVLGLSEDGRHLLLATDADATRAGYSIAMDSRLDRIIRSEPARGSDEPTLAVKDIQAALRAGATPEEVAAQLGVAVSRIERYAGPVISERERILDQALTSYAVRSRLGRSTLTLGDAVARNLGIPREAAEWTVVRGADGVWVLRLAVTGPHRRRGGLAAWSYDPGSRELVPLDASAASLGHLERGRPAAAPNRARAASAPATKPVKKTGSAKPKSASGAAKPAKAAAPAVRAAKATGTAKAASKRTPLKPAPKKTAKQVSPTVSRAVAANRQTPRVGSGRATPARPARQR